MAPERSSADFGRKLRDAREKRGISLRQIASATKISVSALEALERNDISRLPGGIFSRAFVRSYALEVGLDPEATIQDFIAQFPSDSVTAGHPTTDRVEDEEAVESDRRMATTGLQLALISIPIAIAVVYFGTSGRKAAPTETPAATASAASSSAPEARAPESAAPAADLPAATSEPAAPPTAVDDRLVVNLSVTRPCWISASVDGQKKLERLLQPGDPQTIDVTRELVLTAGDASAVEMTLNGAPARPLGKSGEVVTRRLNPTNFKEFLQPR